LIWQLSCILFKMMIRASICLIVWLFIAGCDSENFQNLQTKFSFSKSETIIFKNIAQQKNIEIRINGKPLYRSVNEIVKDANDLLGVSIGERIWRFTTISSYHFPPLSGDNWLHNPILFFNSVGFGFCDDVAIVNMVLWRKAGLRSRTWSVNNGVHIISEFSVDSVNWHQYDSDLGFFFQKRGIVLSLTDFYNDGVNIDSTDRIGVDGNNQLRASYIESQRNNWDIFKFNYSSMNNSVVSHSLYEESDFSMASYLRLRPGWEITIGEKLKEEIFTDMIEGKKWSVPHYYNLVLKVPPMTESDDIEMPLLICNITGHGVIILNQKEYTLPEDKALISLLFSEWKTPVTKVHISETSGLEITYLLNPLLFSGNNDIVEFRSVQ
jgi:hypothetical protein